MQHEEDVQKQRCTQAMRAHGDAVYRLAFARTRNRADAEDVYQTTFLRYFMSKKQLGDAQHEKAWLLRVAINACIDLQRSAWKTKVAAMPENYDIADETQGSFGQTSQEGAIAQAMANLSPEQRTAVHLHYFEGYATGEIAQMLGIRPSTARSHLHRARIAMKVALQDAGLGRESAKSEASSKNERRGTNAGTSESQQPKTPATNIEPPHNGTFPTQGGMR